MLEGGVEVAGFGMQDGEDQPRTTTAGLFRRVFEDAARRLPITACLVGLSDLGVGTLHRRERRFGNLEQLRTGETVRQHSFKIAGFEVRCPA